MIADVTAGVHAWWGPALAFAAGLVSFASPCVLPLVPGYLSFVTGSERPGVEERRALYPIVLFILGFTVVFTFIGAFTASVLSSWLKSTTGQRLAGVIVLSMGVFMVLYALRLGMPWLYREERPLLSRVKPGPAGAFFLGMAFAVGWTPCLGPVLGAILTLAAAQTSVRAVTLLLFYSLGLGVPFLLVGLGVRWLLGTFRFFSRNYHWLAGVSGVALIVIGILLMAGQWTRLIAPLLREVNNFTPAI